MTWPDKIEVTTLGGQSLGRYTYDQYEREFGYEVIGHASTTSKKTKAKASSRPGTTKKPTATTKKADTAKRHSKDQVHTAAQPTIQREYIGYTPRYDTSPWSPSELERLETVIDELGVEAAFQNFKKTTNRDPVDIKNQIAMLRRPSSNTRLTNKSGSIRPHVSNESGPWTKDEDEMLEVFAAELTPEEVYELFPKRRSFDVDARLRELHLKTLPSKAPKEGLRPKQSSLGRQKVEFQAAPRDPDGWTKREVETLKLHYRECIDQPNRLRRLFPGRAIWQIDLEAKRRGIIRDLPKRNAKHIPRVYMSSRSTSHEGGRPSSDSGLQKPSKSPSKKQKRAAANGSKDGESQRADKQRAQRAPEQPRHTAPSHIWTPEEDAIIREHFPKQGYEWPGWRDKLPGITRAEIRKRCEELAPASDNALEALAAKFNKGK